MPTRKADAIWRGNLKDGNGTMRFHSGAFEGQYTFASRFERGGGTNPEELIAAAHAGCFSMALSHALSQGGHTPTSVHTTAKVHLEKSDGGFSIAKIELDCQADVPGLSDEQFQSEADQAKQNCPVSKALAGTEIVLQARLTSAAPAGE